MILAKCAFDGGVVLHLSCFVGFSRFDSIKSGWVTSCADDVRFLFVGKWEAVHTVYGVGCFVETLVEGCASGEGC